MLNEIYFKPDEDIISSIYVLKSDIPSVQLMNVVTVRIPVKIRFDSEKLLFSVRIKIGLVWRRLEANFEDIAGNSMNILTLHVCMCLCLLLAHLFYFIEQQ
jgi:hypothetical protein